VSSWAACALFQVQNKVVSLFSASGMFIFGKVMGNPRVCNPSLDRMENVLLRSGFSDYA
jgi:hypothetical protein